MYRSKPRRLHTSRAAALHHTERRLHCLSVTTAVGSNGKAYRPRIRARNPAPSPIYGRCHLPTGPAAQRWSQGLQDLPTTFALIPPPQSQKLENGGYRGHHRFLCRGHLARGHQGGIRGAADTAQVLCGASQTARCLDSALPIPTLPGSAHLAPAVQAPLVLGRAGRGHLVGGHRIGLQGAYLIYMVPGIHPVSWLDTQSLIRTVPWSAHLDPAIQHLSGHARHGHFVGGHRGGLRGAEPARVWCPTAQTATRLDSTPPK